MHSHKYQEISTQKKGTVWTVNERLVKIFLRLKESFYMTKCSSNGNWFVVWRTDAVVWLSGKKKTIRKNLDLYVSKANSKSSTGEAAPMLYTELDYKLLQQTYLLILSLFLSYTFPSLPATISLFNLPYLASFLFSEQMEFFDVFQNISFCFSTWTCLSNCVQKVSWKDFWDNIPLPSLTVPERCWQGPAWSPAIGQELERLMGKMQYIHHVMRAMCQAVSAGLCVYVWVSVWPGEEEFMSTHLQYCSLLSFSLSL